MKADYDVLGIGNAIVDVIASVHDEFLTDRGLRKGSMQLLDADESEQLYTAMGEGAEASGGSAANTIAGIASLGGRAAFVGKVKSDELGTAFARDIRDLGILYKTPMASGGPSTARCLVLVTPDAQRTMNTYLGACVTLGPEDVDADLVQKSSVTYLEGYLWDPPAAKEAFRKAMKIAHESRRQVALTLSDGFCVERYRDEFRELVEQGVDLVFANEEEICSLYQTQNFQDALTQLRDKTTIAALTRGEKGAVIIAEREVIEVPPIPVDQPVDTTGAGDQFAAGFLFGHTRGFEPARCGALGAMAASEVISHYGARPQRSLAELAQSLDLG